MKNTDYQKLIDRFSWSEYILINLCMLFSIGGMDYAYNNFYAKETPPKSIAKDYSRKSGAQVISTPSNNRYLNVKTDFKTDAKDAIKPDSPVPRLNETPSEHIHTDTSPVPRLKEIPSEDINISTEINNPLADFNGQLRAEANQSRPVRIMNSVAVQSDPIPNKSVIKMPDPENKTIKIELVPENMITETKLEIKMTEEMATKEPEYEHENGHDVSVSEESNVVAEEKKSVQLNTEDILPVFFSTISVNDLKVLIDATKLFESGESLIEPAINIREVSSKNKYNLLHYAAMNGKIESLRVILESGLFGINDLSEDEHSNTPLLLACYNANLFPESAVNVVQLLIDNGANIELLNNARHSRIFAAGSHSDVVNLLLDQNADFNAGTDINEHDSGAIQCVDGIQKSEQVDIESSVSILNEQEESDDQDESGEDDQTEDDEETTEDSDEEIYITQTTEDTDEDNFDNMAE